MPEGASSGRVVAGGSVALVVVAPSLVVLSRTLEVGRVLLRAIRMTYPDITSIIGVPSGGVYDALAGESERTVGAVISGGAVVLHGVD